MAETQQQRRQRQRREEKAETAFRNAHTSARGYGADLRRYARHLVRIIEGILGEDRDAPLSPGQRSRIDAIMRRYTAISEPWARATAARMIAEVNRRSLTAWERHAKEMSGAIRKEIREAPVGETMQQIMAEQVHLITSLPLETAQHIHERTLHAIETSARYPEATEMIATALAEAHPDATERWIENRATLIARTETARTASVLVQARAQHIGAEEYEWRTAGDARVRPSHRALNHTVHRWDEPPVSDPPDYHSHPGQIWNCRCVAIPIIRDD